MALGPDKQPWLRRAFVDFREAIRSHEDTPFFCFRAIEDLRQRFVSGEDTNVKKTWNEMACALSLADETKEYVWKTLRPLAISVRHGAAAKVTRESGRECFESHGISLIALLLPNYRSPRSQL